MSFPVDGLTRKPKFVEQSQLLLPRELREAGIPEIPALPARGPEVNELAALEVEDVIDLTSRGSRKLGKILRLKRLEGMRRFFLPAVALVYRGDVSGEHRVSFAISGRLSEEHERAFAKSDGLKRCQRFAGLGKHTPPKLAEVVGEDIAAMLPGPKAVRELDAALASARVEVAEAERRGEQVTSESQQTITAKAIAKAHEQLAAAQSRQDELVVRPIPVYEHPRILRDSIKTASKRLLILSPWIRRAVVTRGLIKELESLLKRGVVVHIGFGLGEEDSAASSADRDAVRDLEMLARGKTNLVVRRLGNTHAKVLIKDSEFFVVTSFNWLSYQGNPARTFREEWGTYVGVPQQVDAFYDELVERIDPK